MKKLVDIIGKEEFDKLSEETQKNLRKKSLLRMMVPTFQKLNLII